MDWALLIPSWVFTIAITVAVNYFGFQMKTSARLTQLESRYEIFWKVIEPHLANIIHSPEHRERDLLIERMTKGGKSTAAMTVKELEETVDRLSNCLHDDCATDKKHIAAIFLLARATSLLEEKVRRNGK